MTLKEKRKKYLEEELKNREIDIKFFIASICEEIKNNNGDRVRLRLQK